MLERRAGVADLLDLGELMLVLAEREASARVRQDVAALLRGVRVIDRHDRRPGRQGRAVRERPLVPRLGQQRHTVARRDAERHEAAGELANGVPELGIAHVAPPGIVVEAQRHASMALGRSQHHLAQGQADSQARARRVGDRYVRCVRHLAGVHRSSHVSRRRAGP